MTAIAMLRPLVAPMSARVVDSTSVKGKLHEAARGEPDWSGLVHRAAAGDHAALAELSDATSHLVFGLALRIIGDRNEAEDAVVEVYAQAWRNAHTYDPSRGTPCSWLLTLTRSRAIDMLRSRRRERATDPIESASDVQADTPNPEDITADAERHRFVRCALEGLNAEQRQAIELAYFSGLSHTEIAMHLGQPLGTIKTRIRLGMMRLREVLEHLSGPVMTASVDHT